MENSYQYRNKPNIALAILAIILSFMHIFNSLKFLANMVFQRYSTDVYPQIISRIFSSFLFTGLIILISLFMYSNYSKQKFIIHHRIISAVYVLLTIPLLFIHIFDIFSSISGNIPMYIYLVILYTFFRLLTIGVNISFGNLKILYTPFFILSLFFLIAYFVMYYSYFNQISSGVTYISLNVITEFLVSTFVWISYYILNKRAMEMVG